MIPFLAIEPKTTKQQIRNLKHNLHLLSPSDRKRAKKEIASWDAEHNPPAPKPTEHTVSYSASRHMLKDEEDLCCVCPVSVERIVNGKSRQVVVAAEDFEDFTEWLERYGCNWQEES